ncbi:MAG: hypothetical protein IKP67_01320, partial [Spirochaetales bacterium]|nr:hypothetical protein [Spirochaetales bacterium]
MKLKLSLLFLCLIALLWSCPSDDYRYVALGGSRYSSTTIPRQTYNADSFFWGTWISMADGTAYNMQEQKVSVGDKLYWYKDGTSGDTLVAADLGKFVKQSDSVIINNSIPYFRQGGANLEYKVKIVGFSDSRAGATAIPLKNTKVKTQSETYASFSKDATTDVSGDVTLIMPTVNDVQTITVEKKDGGSVVVPNVKIETNNSNIGTIAVVQEGDYSLKVYGNVTNKDDGYMYADKWYNMTLVIKNISDVKAETSFVTVSTDDAKLMFDKADNESFDVKAGQAVSTLNPGMEKLILMKVQYQDIDDGYADTELKITIENTETNQIWEDYISLRFFKGQYQWTINAESTEGNSSAALHGFLVYPDKVCQYFDINDNSHKTILVPSFRGG